MLVADERGGIRLVLLTVRARLRFAGIITYDAALSAANDGPFDRAIIKMNPGIERSSGSRCGLSAFGTASNGALRTVPRYSADMPRKS